MKLLAVRTLLSLAAWLALAASAQTAPTLARIGYLTPTPQTQGEAVFREELAKLGWVEGRNLAIEYRNANGRFDDLSALAAELVRLRVDVIVTIVTQASIAAKGATKSIPVVMVGVGDPVGAKLVASFARPGGNITGSSLASIDVIGKQLELLRELQPGIGRVAVLSNPANAVYQAQQLEEAKAVAAKLGVGLTIVEARRHEALEAAFQSVARARAESVLILGDPMFGLQAKRIARLAEEHRLPSVGPFPSYADAGALLAYGASFDEMFRRAAVYVDRILKGAKPGDLPVERATRFELIVNLRTARALGIPVPPALVSRADRVVE